MVPRAADGSFHPHELQKSRQEAPQQEEKPQAEGDLFGREVRKPDEGGIKVDFDLGEARKEPFPRDVGLRQKQDGNLGHLGVIGMQPVQQMKQHGDGKSDEESLSREITTKGPLFGFFADFHGHPKEREIHLFVFDPLVAEQPGEAQKGRVHASDENTPQAQGRDPNGPRNPREDFVPGEVPTAFQTTVQKLHRFDVLGKEPVGQELKESLACRVARGRKPGRCGDIDEKGAEKARIGDSRGHGDHGPQE